MNKNICEGIVQDSLEATVETMVEVFSRNSDIVVNLPRMD